MENHRRNALTEDLRERVDKEQTSFMAFPNWLLGDDNLWRTKYLLIYQKQDAFMIPFNGQH
ncbi:hypothetical protein K040078D81_01260 [Blautia hominis]|uniref:Uncharacterized protein n=1 Tax=Blautia hominis TaxID=2025493 RepID=A0ABQ0B3H4_9FIRM